jgi:hypothetical protein
LRIQGDTNPNFSCVALLFQCFVNCVFQAGSDKMDPNTDHPSVYSSLAPRPDGKPVNGSHSKNGELSFAAESRSLVGLILRLLILDLGLLLFFALYVSMLGLEWISKEYLIPQLHLQLFTPEKAERDVTYYHRICTPNHQTAHNTDDLLIDYTTMTPQTVVDKMLYHGVTVLPRLLSPATAHELRNFILDENQKSRELIHVIENEHRWSFPIQVDQHPMVALALEEILQKPFLVEVLEGIMGPDPAVIEFTAITQEYGAKQQFWHQDGTLRLSPHLLVRLRKYAHSPFFIFAVVPAGSAAKYARSFIPSYSLFIPLQNVTAAMGATGICPGTHMCAEGPSDFCTTTGFQVSGRRDNWPLGYGALVNQQTTHRGSAYTDPAAMERVVFILTFAPRPLTAPHTVESRLIGTAGSYSLHWSQWGHTLSDFQQPLERMPQPWRTLRSLGIYNARRHWGWDYITVSSGRITYSDTGFTDSDLEDFLSKGGFPWLPRQLQGNMTWDDENSEITNGWVTFLRDTLAKCKDASFRLYIASLVGYMGLSLLLIMFFWKQQTLSRGLATHFVRLVILHAVVLLVGWSIQRRVVKSTWGRNIKSQRIFSAAHGRLSLAPSTPATLINENDILILEGMQSKSMSSFTRVLEVFHPGNKEWNDLVQFFAPMYDQASQVLQHQICQRLLQVTQQESRRILIKNNRFNWAVATPELSHLFCHKSLIQRSSHYMHDAIQSLDFLISESRHGYWRNTSLQRNYIAPFVFNLRNQVMKRNSSLALHLSRAKKKDESKPSFPFVVYSFVPKRSVMESEKRDGPRGVDIPPIVTGHEPFLGAWLQEGDVAEASFGALKNGMFVRF